MGTRAYSNVRMQKINATGNFENCAHWSYKMKKIWATQTSKKPEEEWRKCDIPVSKYERKIDVFKREEVEWVEVAQHSVYCKFLGEGSTNTLTSREGKNILKELSY